MSLPNRRRALAMLAAGIASLAWGALILQLWLTLGVVIGQGRGVAMGLVVYFGFFTVLTNLLAALVVSAHVAGPGFPGYRRLASPLTLTTAATAITMVSLVYFLILRHVWNPRGLQFVADAALHYAVPLLVVVFWALAVRSATLNWRDAPWLFAYPLAYLVYVFLRGELVGLYPYGFVDVLQLGYSAAQCCRHAAGLRRNCRGVLRAQDSVALKPEKIGDRMSMNPFANMAVLAVMLVTQAGWAQTSEPQTECAAPVTQTAMNACAYEDFLAATAGYAERGKAVARQLSDGPRRLFLRSQSAWLTYRTAACDFESSAVQGGSAHSMVMWQCAARMTRARSLELATLGNCPEGDIACVRPNRSSMPAAPDQRQP